MQFISLLLFALSSNMDNFIVGITYGSKKTHIGGNANLIIGLITFLGTFLSMTLGKGMVNFIPAELSNVLGSIILLCIGFFCLIKFFYTEKIKTKSLAGELHCNEHEAVEEEKDLAYVEACTLGAALSINNIGLGIGASLTGINVFAASAAALAFSLIFIYMGNYIGKKCISNHLGKMGEPVASLVIIFLAVYEIFI